MSRLHLRRAVRVADLGIALESYGTEELPVGAFTLVANRGSDLDEQIIRAALPTLDPSQVRVVFPEVKSGPDPQVGSFDPEVVASVVAAGAVIVPVGIRGSFAALPSGARVAVGQPRVSVRFGLALRPGTAPSASDLRTAVAALIAEDETSWWQVLRAEPAVDAPQIAGWRRTWAGTEPAVLGGRPCSTRIWR